MQNVEGNLSVLRARIDAAAQLCGRNSAEITLIGASKTQPGAVIQVAAAAGLINFGENYLDEALEKIDACAGLDLIWHYIGRIQSNKTKLIAENFDWVHTVDRLKIARRLNAHCPADKTLNVLIQTNLDDDPDKGGLGSGELANLVEEIEHLPRLKMRGLMTILSTQTEPSTGYASVAQLAKQTCSAWDTLSMGMSGDLEAAIGAGATHIRVGTALFGPRE